MDTLLQDLRYALRTLGRAPGFTLAAVLTLALGIGATSAIFSVVHGVLLRPLPYAEPDRLVRIYGTYPEFGRTSTSLPDFLDWRREARTVPQMAARHASVLNLTGAGEPQQLLVDRVTANFWETLRVTPALGRAFTPDEERPGNTDVVVLADGFWRRQFAGDPSVVGRVLTLNGRPYEVIGVAPAGFRFLRDVDLYAPVVQDTAAPRRAEYLDVIGRLAPGATVEQASAELATISQRLAEQYPGTNATIRSELVGMHADVVSAVRPALLVFMGAVALVLLVACANVANLLLVRAAGREREMAVRAAIGAGRGRLVRQMLTESVLLALLGGALGLLGAHVGVSLLRDAEVAFLPRLHELGVDATATAFAFGVAVVTGLLFGLAPALRLSSARLHAALKDGARGAAGGAVARFRNALVLAEVALALVLLVGAGLLVRSFDRLNRVDLGFEPQGILTYRVTLPAARYAEADQLPPVFDQLLERTRAIPGVRGASLSNGLPMGGAGYISWSIANRPPRESVMEDAQPFNVSPDHFRLLGIPLRSGRLFTAADAPGAPTVALVNDEFVRRHLDGRDPVGMRLTFGDPSNPESTWWTIVGVVGDVAQEGVTAEPYPQVYRPIAQAPTRGVAVAIRTAGDPLQVAAAARAALRQVDPELPLSDLRTMDDRIGEDLAQPRVGVLLLSVFAAVALALAAIGIYGVIAYGVAQRTREIGIRLALGASTADVRRLVVRQGMVPVLLGVAAGIVGALALTRLMTGLLYGVSATDPLTYALVAFFLAGVALVASWLPARRATRVQPVVALRQE
jgi:predicted permease